MTITKVKFIDTIFLVTESATHFQMEDPNGNVVHVPKQNAQIKGGYIYNKGLKFKILA